MTSAILQPARRLTPAAYFDYPPFEENDRVGRYAQMAVLKPYRGLNLPLYLLLEARQLYVLGGGFTHTWLLFRADRAMSTRFCTRLNFSASSRIVQGEEGACRKCVGTNAVTAHP